MKLDCVDIELLCLDDASPCVSEAHHFLVSKDTGNPIGKQTAITILERVDEMTEVTIKFLMGPLDVRTAKNWEEWFSQRGVESRERFINAPYHPLIRSNHGS